jgi:nucleoside phosphorylase
MVCGGKRMENDLFFDHKLLLESPETLTFQLMSGDGGGTKGIWEQHGLEEKRELMGRVTFNPASTGVYSLSSSVPEALRPGVHASELWDFYFLYIPFNLHPAHDSRKYQKVTFFVKLSNPQVTAFDLFPKNITTLVDETHSFTIFPQLKFGDVDASLGQIGQAMRFARLYPSITAIGEGQNVFYWVYSSDTPEREVLPGCKHALVILRVPHGLPTVEGKISYEVVTARRLGAGWRYVDGKAPPLPVIWKLDESTPFVTASVIQPATRRIVSDVCIIGALFEEADAFMEVASRLCHVQFTYDTSHEDRRGYYAATIQNNQGEPLRIHVSYPPYNGPEETGLHLKPVLKEFRPRLAAMVGICAGDKARVTLGDLVVADRAFLYDTGKFVAGINGHVQHLFDTRTWPVDPRILHDVRSFRSWKADIALVPRPPSKRQQREWLLNKLLDPLTSTVDAVPSDELVQFVPAWHEIVFELQQGAYPLLSRERKLVNPLSIQNLHYGREVFPYQDPPGPRCHIEPMASGNAVRSDAPFKEIQVPVRNALAIDMEGATFYRTVAEFPGVRSLLVKGVSDYADAEKDDSYHKYAATVAATYVLGFIKEYVTLERMPRISVISS